MDANVIIDYARADALEQIFPKLREYVGEVCIVEAVFNEVEEIDHKQCKKLGIKVLKSTFEQTKRANKKMYGLSLQDRLCLWMAVDSGCICVSNDRDLRKACEDHGVEILWGLEIMKELVKTKGLSVSDAIMIAERIRKENVNYCSKKIIDKFSADIKSLAHKNK